MFGGGAAAHHDTVDISLAIGWKTILVGGGGFVTGYDIAPDNTMLARSDTYPALFLWSNSQNKWLPLVTSNSMPIGFVSPRSDKETGAWEARICPSNTSKYYMMYSNAMFVTTNSGGTWTQLTNFPTITDAQPNDSYRRGGWRIAVDPQNDAVVYVGTPSGGLQKSSDSGVTWATDAGVTASAVNGIAIAFDPTSSVSGGKKQGIFACSEGQGVWHSTNGGTSWTKLNTTGMPTSFYRMIVDQNGKLWLSTATTFRLWTWTSGAGWVQNALANNPTPIAVDPANSNNVITSSVGGHTYISTDGGTTWTTPIIVTTVTTTGDAAWQGITNFNGSYNNNPSTFFFDSNSVLYMAWGYGVWKCSNPFASSSAITWAAQSRGIEGLDANYIIHPPGGNQVGVAWDLPIWNFTNVNAYPAAYGPGADYNAGFPLGGSQPGWSIDYASATPSFLVAVCLATPGSCYSSDKGVTWTAFTSQTPFSGAGAGGCIAASTTTNIVAMCASVTVRYTTDGGTTWNASTYVGNGYPTFPFQNSVTVAADRVTANKFYIYSTADGFYSSTNSGATFTKVSSTIAANDGLIRLKAVPSNAGHLFFTGGFLDTGTPPDVNATLTWSINSAVSWSTVSGFTGVQDFGFGTVVSGQTYPTIYCAGWRSGSFGVWMCQNFNPSTGAGTWTLLGTNYPEGWFSLITSVAGDPSVNGACSVSFNNGGFKRYGV